MKTTLSLLILMTFIFGFVMVGNAIAQDDAGPTAVEESPTVTELPDTPEVEVESATPSDIDGEALSESVTHEKPIDQGKGLYNSIRGAEWLVAFGFLGMLLGSLARFATGKKWDFIKTKAGGYTIAGFTGMGILGGLIVEAGSFSVSMISPALMATLAAMALHGPAKAIKKKLAGDTED